MRRSALVGLLVIISVVVPLLASQPTGALPEYSIQTGEPCASCHISPSGGGLRTPRGQAWVGSGRPGSVPSLTEALALLGVRLTVNEADFVALPAVVVPPAPPQIAPTDVGRVRAWLRLYEGN
ncbi:MAG: hypothetical protein ACUVR4_08705 [Anaerolineae bacterium]